VHPITGQHPKISNPTDCIRWLGDGDSGLCGYARALDERSEVLEKKSVEIGKKVQPTISDLYKKLSDQQTHIVAIREQGVKLQESVQQFKKKSENCAAEATGLRARLDRVKELNAENKRKARNL
jgi:hypothetical protein